jgi:3-methylcrotonyl-CoA carboxylase alpha subunit
VVEALGNGRFRVKGRLAYALKDKHRVWVFLEGRSYLIEGDDRAGDVRAHSTDDQMALSAPMPATVIAITATPGQEVAAGDLLVMLEAMKMELPIRAPRAGRVKALACREGDLVQPGVPLVEME